MVQKPEEPKGSTDGRGQLLAMMFAAQALNENPKAPYKPFSWIKIEKNLPIYGSYVIGINWYFIVLYHNEFCMSKAFDATDEAELFQVFRMLKMQRGMIVERIRALTKEVT